MRNKEITLPIARQGMSLIEVMLAVIIFAMGFLPLMKMFSEGGISQQKIVRDFPVTLSIAERILMTIENEIEEGRFDPAMFNSGGPDGVDITEAVVENQDINRALENFYGSDNQSATRFLQKCRVMLATLPDSDPRLIKIMVRFLWNDRVTDSQSFSHSISLYLLKRRE
ncbi:MAG: type IV pilus modification PilV family protein [Myxococcota bacterium]